MTLFGLDLKNWRVRRALIDIALLHLAVGAATYVLVALVTLR